MVPLCGLKEALAWFAQEGPMRVPAQGSHSLLPTPDQGSPGLPGWRGPTPAPISLATALRRRGRDMDDGRDRGRLGRGRGRGVKDTAIDAKADGGYLL